MTTCPWKKLKMNPVALSYGGKKWRKAWTEAY